MKQGTIRFLALTAAALLAGAAMAGGGVWVSDSGVEHSVGHGALFIGDDGATFDLSELEDGQTREFGSADRPLTATRTGDEIRLERPAGDDDKALSIVCTVGTDSCKVMTFGDDDNEIAIMVRKGGAGHFDEDVVAFGGGTRILVEKFQECDPGSDCVAEVHVEALGDAGHGSIVEIMSLSDDDVHGNVFVHAGRHHGLHSEGATEHDLSELLDGETRIFGGADKQVTVVREGDEVRIIREATEDTDETNVTCTIGRDDCRVLTFDDDPDKVAIIIQKTRRCVDGEGDCDVGVFHVGIAEGGDAWRHKVVIVREEDDD